MSYPHNSNSRSQNHAVFRPGQRILRVDLILVYRTVVGRVHHHVLGRGDRGVLQSAVDEFWFAACPSRSIEDIGHNCAFGSEVVGDGLADSGASIRDRCQLGAGVCRNGTGKRGAWTCVSVQRFKPLSFYKSVTYWQCQFPKFGWLLSRIWPPQGPCYRTSTASTQPAAFQILRHRHPLHMAVLPNPCR